MRVASATVALLSAIVIAAGCSSDPVEKSTDTKASKSASAPQSADLKVLGVEPTQHAEASATGVVHNRLTFGAEAVDATAVACGPGGDAYVGGTADKYLGDTPISSQYVLAKVAPEDLSTREAFANAGGVHVEVQNAEEGRGLADLAAAGEFVYSVGSGSGAVVTRHNAKTGALDTSWGKNGVARFAELGDLSAVAVAEPDQIMVAGNLMGQDKAVLMRLDASGRPDPNFANAGALELPALRGVIDIVVDNDGNTILLGGHRTDPDNFKPGTDTPDILRISPTGAIDASYGKSGVGAVTVNAIAAAPSSLALQSDGGVVIAGRHAVARLSPSGSLDKAFGTGGVVEMDDTLPDGSVDAIAAAPDGRILVAGGGGDHTQNGVGSSAWAVLSADGKRDPIFKFSELDQDFPVSATWCADHWIAATTNGEYDGLRLVSVPA